MIKFIFRLFGSLIKAHSPFSKKGDGFAFIVHPRGYGDIVSNIPFLKIFPRSLVIKLFPLLWPFKVSGIYGLKSQKTGEDIKGFVIGVPMLAHQMTENRITARKKIAQAIKLAENSGAKVIGLGALTGSIMEGGAGLSKKNNIIVTAGRAYTAYTIKFYVEDSIKRFNLNKNEITLAIVGAAGGVGKAVTRLLKEDSFKKIILIDLERKLDSVKTEHNGNINITITHQVRDVKEADIIVTVTNAPEAVIEPDDVKVGAILIDDAQPSDLSPELIKNRNDVIIIEAGVIKAPNIKVGTNFRLANRDETYCCLGEVMSLAAFDWEGEYAPQDINPEIIYKIAKMASELGFKIAPYQAFGKIVSEIQIEKVKNIIQNNRK